MSNTPDTAVSIVIPTHSELRWKSLSRTVASARAQRCPVAEIVVVVDHNPALYRRAVWELTGVTVLEKCTPGVRRARTTSCMTPPAEPGRHNPRMLYAVSARSRLDRGRR